MFERVGKQTNEVLVKIINKTKAFKSHYRDGNQQRRKAITHILLEFEVYVFYHKFYNNGIMISNNFKNNKYYLED